jgi:branched-chain amino acid transport system ATP-binding protein
MADVLLSARKLCKHFGGLQAVQEVSLDLQRGCIHAVIGPNGAGKTTLTHLLSGDLAPTAGQVLLGKQDVTGWSPERISHQGLGRSYQKTNLFAPLSVWDNVRLAAQSRSVHLPWNPLVWLQDAARSAHVNDGVQQTLALCGLQSLGHRIAGSLSHGEQRQLEIAMCLATEPSVLLLDEPLAGMGASEAQSMVAMMEKLKKNHAMLLVEHDMDAVFALADQLTVMVNGQVIASGLPQAIRNDAAVQAAYLGDALT